MESTCDKHKDVDDVQGGRTCGAIEEASWSLKANDERVIINVRDKNAVIARDKNDVFLFFDKISYYVMINHDMSWFVMVRPGMYDKNVAILFYR